MRVSLIVTVKNEAESLPRLLDSIAAQTRAPDEIVVADGGSTDATLDLLRANSNHLPLKIISAPGANISQGRNAAIRAASGEIICSTDAGVRLDPNWIAELVRLFDDNQITEGARQKPEAVSSSFVLHPSALADIVSGFFIADPRGVFETALAATTLPALADIRPEKFLPSSRSIAFRKAAWERVNGYPEWLDFCEDLIFDFALRAANYRFVFAPRAIVHFRSRKNLPAFFKQYYQYARGDGKANLWFKRHLIRYVVYLVGLPLLIVLTLQTLTAAFNAAPSGVWTLLSKFIPLPFWLGAALAMFYTPYKRLLPMLRDFSFADKLRAIAWVPIIRVTGDIAKMMGYPVGVLWRVKNRHHIDTRAGLA